MSGHWLVVVSHGQVKYRKKIPSSCKKTNQKPETWKVNIAENLKKQQIILEDNFSAVHGTH